MQEKFLSTAKEGNLAEMKELFSNDKTLIQAKDQRGNTALLWAAFKGHFEVVQWLLHEGGASIDEKNNEDRTALSFAISRGHLSIVQFLVSEEKDSLESKAKALFMAAKALFIAVNANQLEIVQWLVSHAKTVVNFKIKSGNTVLLAASKGYLEIVKFLLQKGGAAINEINIAGDTALLLAVAGNHLDVVQWLLSKEGGASVTERNNEKETAFLLAAKRGYLPMVRFLLSKGGASISEVDDENNTALLLAVAEGHLEIVQYLLKEGGATITEKNESGETALLIAASKNHLSIVQWLLSKEGGASLTDKDNKGNTALLLATSNGHDKIVEDLLQKDNSPLQDRTQNLNLLKTACGCNNVSLIEFLLEKGGCIEPIAYQNMYLNDQQSIDNINNIKKLYPKIKLTVDLHHAVAERDYLKASELLKQDICVNFTDIKGDTLLHRIVMDTNNLYREAMVKTLLEKGANRYRKNSVLKYPVEYLKDDPLRLLLIPKEVQFLNLIFSLGMKKLVESIAENIYFPRYDFTVYSYDGQKRYSVPKHYVSELLFEEIRALLVNQEMGLIQWEPEQSAYLKNLIITHEQKAKLSKDLAISMSNYELTKVESYNLETFIANLQSFNQHLYQENRDSEMGTEMICIRVTEKMIEAYSLKEITSSNDENFQLTSSARLYKPKRSKEEETSSNTNTKKLKTNESSSSRHGSRDPVHRDVKV